MNNITKCAEQKSKGSMIPSQCLVSFEDGMCSDVVFENGMPVTEWYRIHHYTSLYKEDIFLFACLNWKNIGRAGFHCFSKTIIQSVKKCLYFK